MFQPNDRIRLQLFKKCYTYHIFASTLSSLIFLLLFVFQSPQMFYRFYSCIQWERKDGMSLFHLTRTILHGTSFLVFPKLNSCHCLQTHCPSCITHITIENHHQRWLDFEVSGLSYWAFKLSFSIFSLSLFHPTHIQSVTKSRVFYLLNTFSVSFVFLLFLPQSRSLSLASLFFSLF